ncbi:MAG: hypothetical protein QOD55_2384 [Solirubrobacteraceae bacterium]|nr:hypothetical protein [Solirubrobacteraceae bacterium]MEA2290387.1 hypothetical protein [Solirubrobacteraceae bacterium]
MLRLPDGWIWAFDILGPIPVALRDGAPAARTA